MESFFLQIRTNSEMFVLVPGRLKTPWIPGHFHDKTISSSVILFQRPNLQFHIPIIVFLRN